MAGPQAEARLLSWDDGTRPLAVAVSGTSLYGVLPGQKKAPLATASLPLNTWVHVAVSVAGDGRLFFYVNGLAKAAGKLSGPIPGPAGDIAVGASPEGKYGFSGEMDEVGITTVGRSPAWIRASALSQGPESPLLSFGEEEKSTGSAESLTVHLLMVTARAITLDGWIIIGMLVVMMAVTWVCFCNKLFDLRRLNKGNGLFSELFSRSRDLLALDGDLKGEIGRCSLARIYRAGVRELTWKSESLGEALSREKNAALLLQSMGAVRTALDEAVLKESKANSSGLLLFTLSISGGPFMGLFGTVWGVINTFAGVAEAGEANLAAIAPGVASALSCTLMGLMLAIPALFHYNYLASLARAINGDMNVFAGRFASRIEAEYAGRM